MTRNARNRFVAWLGIAAMWLAIVAPVISQTIAARQAAGDPQTALCSVDMPTGQAHELFVLGANADANANAAHPGHHDAASHFDACSYCGLLAHNLPVFTHAATALTRIERVTRVATIAHIESVASKSFNAASPRAPPVLS